MNLTPPQRDRITATAWAQEWIEYGCRVTPLTEHEWETWEAGVRKCYELSGVPWPGVVVRVSSPLHGAFAASIHDFLSGDHTQDTNIRDRIWDSVPVAFGTSIRASVEHAVWDAVSLSVWNNIYDNVRENIHTNVRAVVGDAIFHFWRRIKDSVQNSPDARIWKDVWRNARFEWMDFFGGRTWCDFVAHFAYFRDAIKIHVDGALWDHSRAFQDAQSAGWWWPRRDFVLVCDNPAELHLETIGGLRRMHCETGPAISWADGWGVYMWHGTRVPADLIETDWDVEKIMAERNTEVRRCAIDDPTRRRGRRHDCR